MSIVITGATGRLGRHVISSLLRLDVQLPDLVAAGRDTECKALSNAVKWHCEGRVVLRGNRTVVLR